MSACICGTAAAENLNCPEHITCTRCYVMKVARAEGTHCGLCCDLHWRPDHTARFRALAERWERDAAIKLKGCSLYEEGCDDTLERCARELLALCDKIGSK